MTKILVCGDWHGNAAAAKAMAKKATSNNCQIIVQCGDFGFWPHTNPDYVHQVNQHLTKYDISMVWVDGNHENFTLLFGTDWPRTKSGFQRIADKVLYAPRGHRWEWDGVRFLALGGAYSIDKGWRLSQGPEGMYWWRQETITQADVMRCGTEPTDVMITHDMPSNVDSGFEFRHNAHEDALNRAAVRAVVDVVKPFRLYHGHYHHRKDSLLRIEGAPPVEIVALDMWQGLPLSTHWTILDLQEITERRAA